MTKDEFRKMTERSVLLDGATGSQLMAAGMPKGSCTELWTFEHKDAIQKLQRKYVEAGTQILYAPTFGANGINLARFGVEERVEEINRGLVRYAREVAEGRAWVAGDVTTTGRIIGRDAEYTRDMARRNYRGQMQALLDAGVDLIVIETMIECAETEAAVEACRELCDLPIMVTMTVRSNGSIFYGGSLAEFAPRLEQMGVDAVGFNCVAASSSMLDVVRTIAGAVAIPVIAKPNAGIPKTDAEGRLIYDCKPEVFAEYASKLRQNGAVLLGGCCGTAPEHIRAVRAMLDDEKRIKMRGRSEKRCY